MLNRGLFIGNQPAEENVHIGMNGCNVKDTLHIPDDKYGSGRHFLIAGS